MIKSKGEEANIAVASSSSSKKKKKISDKRKALLKVVKPRTCMSLMNHDYVKFMVYDMWIITVNRKLNSLNSVQETNLKHDMTVIRLCAMLRNFYEIMLLR